jgi:hypothetical protein
MFYRPNVNLRMTWDRSKHAVLYNQWNLVVFGQIPIYFFQITTLQPAYLSIRPSTDSVTDINITTGRISWNPTWITTSHSKIIPLTICSSYVYHQTAYWSRFILQFIIHKHTAIRHYLACWVDKHTSNKAAGWGVIIHTVNILIQERMCELSLASLKIRYRMR